MGRRRKIKIESEQIENKNEILAGEENQNETTDSGNAENVENVENSQQPEPGNENSYETDLKEIDAIIQNTKTEKRGRKSKEEKARVALTIPGSLFVRMHNLGAANILSLVDTYISKDKAIPTELLSMDEKVIQELAPVAELAMKEMKVEENPIAAFYVMFAAATINQFASLKVLVKQAMKENPDFKIQDLIKK